MALVADLLGLFDDLPAGVPRDVAVLAGITQPWNLCNSRRQRCRDMYTRIRVASNIGRQALLAARTASVVCKLHVGIINLPSEVLVRIMDFVVPSRYHIQLPISLVTWMSPLQETGYYRVLVQMLTGQVAEHIATVRALLGLETDVMRRFEVRLRRLVDDAERNSDSIWLGQVALAAGHSTGALRNWLRALRIEITTSLPVVE